MMYKVVGGYIINPIISLSLVIYKRRTTWYKFLRKNQFKKIKIYLYFVFTLNCFISKIKLLRFVISLPRLVENYIFKMGAKE